MNKDEKYLFSYLSTFVKEIYYIQERNILLSIFLVDIRDFADNRDISARK